VEALVEPAGLPTRTEIDEIHQTVQDLKRRVRQLEKAATRSDASEKPAAKSSIRAPRKSKAAATHPAPAEQGADA
jgi:hypothetical protein